MNKAARRRRERKNESRGFEKRRKNESLGSEKRRCLTPHFDMCYALGGKKHASKRASSYLFKLICLIVVFSLDSLTEAFFLQGKDMICSATSKRICFLYPADLPYQYAVGCKPKTTQLHESQNDSSGSQHPSSAPNTNKILGVTLKIAVDQQGAVADLAETKSERFTCAESLDMVHRLRRDSDAVLVGRSTVEMDNCTLTVRRVDPEMVHGRPQQPVRVVVDPKRQLPLKDYMIVTDGLPTIIVHSAAMEECNEDGYSLSTLPNFPNVTMLGISKTISSTLSSDPSPRLSAKAIVDALCKACKINHIMVEGGPNTALQFLEECMVDRVILVQAPMQFTEPLPSNIDENVFQKAGLEKLGSYKLGVDTVDCYSRPSLPWPDNLDISAWP